MQFVHVFEHLADGAKVVYGIRPEHLDLATKGKGIDATISVVEPTGSETMVVLKAGTGTMTALFRERHDLRPDQTLHLRPRPGSIHAFDAETGMRLAGKT